MLEYLALATHHHAVPVCQAPDTARGAHIHEVEVVLCEYPGASNRVAEVGVAAIYDDVARLEQGYEAHYLLGSRVARRDHDPHGFGLFLEVVHQLLNRESGNGPMHCR